MEHVLEDGTNPKQSTKQEEPVHLVLTNKDSILIAAIDHIRKLISLGGIDDK